MSQFLTKLFVITECADFIQKPNAIEPVKQDTVFAANVGERLVVDCEGFYGRLDEPNCGKDAQLCVIGWIRQRNTTSEEFSIDTITNDTNERVYKVSTQ